MNKKSIAKLLSLLMVLNISLSTFHASGTANVDRNMDKASTNTSKPTNKKKLLGAAIGLPIGVGIGATAIIGLVVRSHKQQKLQRILKELTVVEKQKLERFAKATYDGGTINDIIIGGATTIFSAIERNCTDVVKILIKIDANSLKVRDTDGNTPLMRAVRQQRKNMVEMLLGAGANVMLRNKAGKTALDIAEAGNMNEIAALIRAKQAEMAPRV